MSATPPDPSGENARHQRLTSLFEQALGLDDAARSQFLEQLHGDDAELRSELESLLDLDEEDDPFLEPAMGLAAQFEQPLRQKGEKIGNYEIERAIGSGGAGDVYLAHQLRPRRLVAIKVMRQGLVDPTRVAKFEFEAQLLARLQHAGIAQVFEAGVYEDRGKKMPFFVMEFVDGAKTLTAHAEDKQLGLPDRLRLFAGVCEAVSHGHQHGIAHCDLKPENVLVSPDGSAKVIDFGIARASDHDPNVTTLQTGSYQLAGTLPYMSPEQAAGTGGIDVRTDVYSLGAMLFELLTRSLPLDVTGVSIPKAAHLINTAAPAVLGSHGSQYRGDLETIVAKCLEKEPQRRYRDAGELARDIRRFLLNEPIHARRPTVLYQVRKFTRRHRGLVLGSTLAVFALIAGSAIAVGEAIKSAQGEARSRWVAYRASISAAGSALATHDVAQARINLMRAPEEHRNWEWRHLMARLDDSVYALPTGGGQQLGTPFFETIEGHRAVGIRQGDVSFHFDLATGERLARKAAVPMSIDEETQTKVFIEDRVLVIERNGAELRRHELKDLGLSEARWRHLSIAPGGRYVLISNNETAARVDLTTKSWQATRVDPGSTGVAAACIARSGHAAFVAGLQGKAALWKVDAEQLELLPATFGPARSVAFHPHLPRLAVGLHDTTIGIWNVEPLERTVRADGHQHAVTAVAYSSDGSLLYSGSLDRSFRVWRAPKLASLSINHGHERGIIKIVADPKTGTVASAGEDGTLRIWDGKQPFQYGVLHDHDGFVFPLAYSADGELIASAGNDQTVRIWSAQSQQLIATIPSPLRAALDLCFNASGSRLLGIGRGRTIVWDLHRGVRLTRGTSLPMFMGTARNASFAADGTTVLIPQYSEDGNLLARNLDTQEANIVPLARLLETDARTVSDDRRFAVLTVSTQPTGRAAQANSDSGARLTVVEAATGKTVPLPEISGAFAWIRGTNQLAVRRGTDHTQVLVIDVETQQVLAEIDGHSERIYAICCSPDGTRLCTSGRDGVRLWAVGRDASRENRIGHRIVELQGHSSFVWSARWQPNGNQIATGGGDGTIRLWGVDSALESRQARIDLEAPDPQFDQLMRQHGTPAKLAAWLEQGGDGLPKARRRVLRMRLLAQHSWK